MEVAKFFPVIFVEKISDFSFAPVSNKLSPFCSTSDKNYLPEIGAFNIFISKAPGRNVNSSEKDFGFLRPIIDKLFETNRRGLGMGKRDTSTLNALSSGISSLVKICKIICFYFLKEFDSSANVTGLIYIPISVGFVFVS